MTKKKVEKVEKKDTEVNKPNPGSIGVNTGNVDILTLKLLEAIAKNTGATLNEIKLLRESIK
ncbi:MAG: hypothetical protein E2O29_02070 [Deltaproteobacteria bacterium]|nr:MAG: hypothetical protein E2O29_02070 [Deltaproteobacteria bacterium]